MSETPIHTRPSTYYITKNYNCLTYETSTNDDLHNHNIFQINSNWTGVPFFELGDIEFFVQCNIVHYSQVVHYLATHLPSLL